MEPSREEYLETIAGHVSKLHAMERMQRVLATESTQLFEMLKPFLDQQTDNQIMELHNRVDVDCNLRDQIWFHYVRKILSGSR